MWSRVALLMAVAVFLLLPAEKAEAATCLPPPSGLISWWPGDANADDLVDDSDGTLQDGATFAPGTVGQAFSFDGSGDFVRAQHSASLQPAHITVELWMQSNTIATDSDRTNLISKGHRTLESVPFFSGWTIEGTPQGNLAFY